ncbi:PTPDL family protein [Roseibacillus ishigakijimensis]|uniref:Uncharacterized protein n=1 Tax=Roseibacillus ishigakijimensis TaxID=454146 RepID=A0A934RN34_9BACT|nr:PTPDL family protein [Roseibacillus ishigakijimensis]MBK1833815.1 hypothetical protein [Roseibacillus ishigakijimensis]
MKILTSALLVACAVPAAADIFTLKDGTKLDAEIIEKTLDEYVLDVAITKSIRERRTIKRDEVVNVERVNESDTIFEENIAGLTPAPPFLDLAGYDERIKKVKSFLSAHQLTSAGTKASRMLKELEEERAFVAEGGVKTAEGRVSTAERAQDALGIESQGRAQEFNKLVKDRSFIPALREYSKLEMNYFGTEAHRQAVPLAQKVVATYAQLLDRELNGFEEREERRLESLERLPDSDRRRALAAEEQRQAAYEKLWQKEEEAEEIWYSVDTKNGGSMNETLEQLLSERERLENVAEELKDFPVTDKLYRDGWTAAGEKNQEELEGILDQLDEAGVAESYLNMLVDRFDPTINNPPAEGEPAEDEEAEEEIESDY